MENLLQEMQDMLAMYGIDLVAALAIFIIGKWVSKILKGVLRRFMERARVDATLISFTTNLAYASLLVFVVLASLNQLGIQTTSFIAVIGAAGLAIGLSMQSSLSNFAAGVMMIVFRPFKVGDFIEAAGTAGTVLELNIFTTKLKTGDNRIIFVPNGKIIADNIVNVSANDIRRIDMVFGIGYGDDIKAAKSIIEDVLKSEERVLDEPEPVIGVIELGDSSVNIAVRPWVKKEDFLTTQFVLNETLKERFDAAKISIPYPQRDVHLYQPQS